MVTWEVFSAMRPPPPAKVPELPMKVVRVIVTALVPWMAMPPPRPPLLPLKTLSSTVSTLPVEYSPPPRPVPPPPSAFAVT